MSATVRGSNVKLSGVRAAIAIALVAGLLGLTECDWFEEVNSPPAIELRTGCPSWGDVVDGDSVTFAWTASDFDGEVVGYEWSYDGSVWVATSAESAVIQDVSAGEHTFRVLARDNTGDISAEPAECSFTALPEGVDRVVLVEVFTTNICKNCKNAEGALGNLLVEMGTDNLTVVAYHDKPPDAPNSDGLATDETDARIGWYTTDPNYFPEAWPVAVFDGLRPLLGAENVEAATSLYRFEIADRLALVSPIRLGLTGEIEQTGGSVVARVEAAGRLSGNPLVLHLVLIEDDVSYNGYFAKVFDFVARDILNDYPLTLAAIGDTARVDTTFSISERWLAAKMDVIAFVQDTSTREVIQAARLRHE
jgi:hypothetical protein